MGSKGVDVDFRRRLFFFVKSFFEEVNDTIVTMALMIDWVGEEVGMRNREEVLLDIPS